MRTYYRIAVLFIGVVLAYCCCVLDAAVATNVDEYTLKASCISNFLKFIDFSQDSLNDTRLPVKVCILGEDHFGPVLDNILGGAVRGRGMEITRINQLEADNMGDMPYHVIFLSKSLNIRTADILKSIDRSNSLTIGESPSFCQMGGMISMSFENSKIKLAINDGAARRAGVKISSQLLKLATRIETRQ